MNDDNKINPISLDTRLDDIEDLPAFVTPRTGAYHVRLEGIEQKEVGGHPSFEAKCTIAAIHEMAETDPEVDAKVPTPGDQFSLLFMADNKFGAGNLKSFLVPLAKHFNTSDVGTTIEAAKAADLLVVLKKEEGKGERAGKFFPRLKSVAVI